MNWSGSGAMGAWGWALMVFGVVVFWVVVITAGVLVYRYVTRSDRQAPPQVYDAVPSPQQILVERYARGEISEDEYTARLGVLRHAQRR